MPGVAALHALLVPILAAGAGPARNGDFLRGRRLSAVTPPVLLSSASSQPAAALQVSVTMPLPTYLLKDGVCVDRPDGWTDSRGATCKDYALSRWCTAQGEPGPDWWGSWGTLGAYSYQGHSAVSACCACGGGILSCCANAQKVNAEKEKVVNDVRSYAAPLADSVSHAIGVAGNSEVNLLDAKINNATVSVIADYLSGSASLRQQALAELRANFSSMTANRENLFGAATDHIVLAGSKAAWDAVNATLDAKNTKQLTSLAARGLASFRNATKLWNSTNSSIHELAKKHWQALFEFYEGQNSSINAIENISRMANAFADASQVVGREVRWSHQASALAVDLADVSERRTALVDAMVHQAENRALRGLQLTSVNSDTIDELGAMADKAEENADMSGQIVS